MEIFSVNDEKFRKYGKVWNNIECTKLIKGMEHTPLPEDVIYVPSVEELEAVPEAKTFSERVFGGLPIQIGYCNGNNHRLNAVEYHRNSEIRGGKYRHRKRKQHDCAYIDYFARQFNLFHFLS